ncbi:doublesex and mab-3 related transcription factor 1-like [Acanthaster planci]|uniref:Doublesex and mab-3 related transcription factor 1-like n=1 Tax=Acanthaster planci TaxID=133434 RepID=A0A8B8A700_ACAPL|nr:doublesex and mab-3 related transcription factor 1-like [Acanthaster planci]
MGKSIKKRHGSKRATEKRRCCEDQGEVVESTSDSPIGPGRDLARNVKGAGEAPTSPGIHGDGAVERGPVTGSRSVTAGRARPPPPGAGDGGKGSSQKRRGPHCARCRSHGVLVPLKGHKKFCNWKNCKCANCQLVMMRRKLMARMIALHRQQDLEAFALQQTGTVPTCSLPGDEVPDPTIKNLGSTNVPLVQSSSSVTGQSATDLLNNFTQGNLPSDSVQASPHSNIQCQWNSNNSMVRSPADASNEIQIQLPSSNELDIPSPLFGAGLASHGGSGRGGSLGPLMAFAPCSSSYSHQQLSFPFGLLTNPKPSTPTSQIYSPNFLVYHHQQQQEQQQVPMQQPYYFQGNRGGETQSAFMPIGQQNPPGHHSGFGHEDSPSPSGVTSPEPFNDIAVLGVASASEPSGIQPAGRAPASHTLRIPLVSRTVQPPYPPPSNAAATTTMSNFHCLPSAASSATQARAFIPLQHALFPQKHTQDSNKN